MKNKNRQFYLPLIMICWAPAALSFCEPAGWKSVVSGKTWDSSDNWSYEAVPDSPGKMVCFQADVTGTVFTVQLANSRAVGHLLFDDTNGHTIWRLQATRWEAGLIMRERSGNIPQITVCDSDDTAFINVGIEGNSGICKSGRGRLVLGVDGTVNNYKGQTRISAGRLSLGGVGGPGMGNASYGIPQESIIEFASEESARFVLNGFDAWVGGLSSAESPGLQIVEAAFDSGIDKPATLTLDVAENVTLDYTGFIRDGGKGTTRLSVRKVGPGMQVLSASVPGWVSYSGTTVVSQGAFRIDARTKLTGDLFVGKDAVLGGGGTVNCDVFFEDGACFLFHPEATLTVNGNSVDLGNLSIPTVVGLDENVSPGIYELMNGTAWFKSDNLQHVGAENAVRIGQGRRAFFLLDQALKLIVF